MMRCNNEEILTQTTFYKNVHKPELAYLVAMQWITGHLMKYFSEWTSIKSQMERIKIPYRISILNS